MNGFLLDTNVPSELVRPRPEQRVVEWVEAQNDDYVFASVITIGEIRKGLTANRDPKQRAFLEHWLQTDLLPWLEGRILPVTQTIAERGGILEGEAKLAGAPLNTADGLIAATALEHEMTVVTRTAAA
jgi:predicted nucleic acid-binding protein